MSVFIVAFMAMLGAMAAVAIAPVLLGLIVISGKAALILCLVLGARWTILKLLHKQDER